ncbi:hypothetical protein [Streptomyces xinghaiensis]|uniref:hypothetical protein n=1 Tax=Streptomyces xinghaiensis TaxID=1038928 RepID=UPI002E1582D7|nr:hypothetical protein OG463_25880 [Streptomyces xinghaiensis]
MTGSSSGDSPATRLNEVPAGAGGGPGPGGGPPILGPGGTQGFGSSPAEKKAAANAIEQHTEPNVRKAGDWAEEATDSAVKTFGARDGAGWLTSGALKKAHSTWGDQVTTLLNRLKSEKEALRATNGLFTNNDLGVGATVRAPSVLDGY